MSQVTFSIPDGLVEKLSEYQNTIADRLRLEAAFALCSRGVLATSLAAKLAGMSYTEFLESAASQKVELFPVNLGEFEEDTLREYPMGGERLANHTAGKNGAS